MIKGDHFQKRHWQHRSRAVALLLACCVLLGYYIYSLSTSEPPVLHYRADFEWDASRGFLGFTLSGRPEPNNPVWLFLVELQVKPILTRYLRQIGWDRINGSAPVSVLAVIPVAKPQQLGGDGAALEDPTVTPLMKAAKRGDRDAVRHLITEGGVAVDSTDQSRRTALLYALLYGCADIGVVRTLLAAGADPNSRDRSGRTPLLLAVRESNPGIVRVLLEGGADPNVQDQQGYTPLANARYWRQEENAQLLQQFGAR